MQTFWQTKSEHDVEKQQSKMDEKEEYKKLIQQFLLMQEIPGAFSTSDRYLAHKDFAGMGMPDFFAMEKQRKTQEGMERAQKIYDNVAKGLQMRKTIKDLAPKEPKEIDKLREEEKRLQVEALKQALKGARKSAPDDELEQFLTIAKIANLLFPSEEKFVMGQDAEGKPTLEESKGRPGEDIRAFVDSVRRSLVLKGLLQSDTEDDVGWLKKVLEEHK
jgi:hypothetical protein